MKRILGIFLVLAGAGALTVFATGASNGGASHDYWVEFDDAFGLISGGDVKAAGVRAGKIGDMKVDTRSHRALVQIKIAKTGFGSLRTDVTCQARPESLIGEYFVDCQPGTAPVELKQGTTIPVTRTSSVLAPDLVNDVLRKPYRERFSIIVNSLGAAVAGNARNLNDAIRRAAPGLRETDKVLKILGDQNHVLADLVKNADKVIGDMSDNRKQVARWVVTADRTSRASAERRSDIAAGFHKLPGFLEQLRPAMNDLGNVATEQTPALRTLSASAPNLKTFFDQLGPFSDVSRPAFRALGKASVTGRRAVVAARPTVAELNRFAQGVPELGKNLAIILEHLDDQQYSAELDPRSPGGKGYSGLQSLLEYVYDQVLSVNIYDSSVHILKVSPFPGPCADYSDVKRAKTTINKNTGHPLIEDCGATLGPNVAGFTLTDTTKPPGAGDARRRDAELALHRPAEPDTASVLPAPGEVPAAAPSKPASPLPELSDVIPGAPHLAIPSPPAAVSGGPAGDTRTQQKLLDYLLKP
jgi:virulence factor Mce-like protein